MANEVQKFLDNLTGLPTLWSLIKQKFVEKETGKGLSTNDFTTALKTKLEGISAGAEVNQNAFSNVTDGTNTIAASSKTDTFTVEAGSNVQVSANASNKKITISATDTTYSAATTSAAGLMSSDDKTKLNGIATGAEVNQHAFSTVTSGSTSINASSKTDEVKFAAGSNVQISANATSKTVTISATDTTYSAVTQTTDGLMTAADKVTLDNLVVSGGEPNQNAYSYVEVGSTTIAADSKTDTLTLIAGSNVTLTPNASDESVTIAATDTTYSEATTSAAGLMSSSDKTKLNGIESGADVNVIETVKVNNTALTVSSKAVNITIAEGATNGTIAANGTDVAVHGLAGAAYQGVAASISDGGTGLTTSDQVYDFATGLIVQTITDGDTTHAPSADAVYDAIAAAVTDIYTFKGSVATEANLPSSGNKVGDVYNIIAASSYGPAGMNVVWTGTGWDALGSSISIEAMTAADVEAICV